MTATERMSRRRAIGALAGAAGATALGLEYAGFRGAFDHRRAAPVVGAARFAASLQRLAREPDLARGASVVHVGHSTHLVCVAGLKMLTDPWFWDPAFGALAHAKGTAVAASEVGELDLVLVTHDHADHADPRALDRLDKRATALVATEALRVRLRAQGYRDVHVLRAWETFGLARGGAGGVRVTAVPAEHDIYEVGFVIEGAGQRVYFAGDTRLHPDMAAIAERMRPTAAILPVDGTRRVGDRELFVMDPRDAVRAAQMLGVRFAMPSHAEADFSDPLAAHVLASTVANANGVFADGVARALPGVRCAVPEPGELVEIARSAVASARAPTAEGAARLRPSTAVEGGAESCAQSS